MSAAPPRVQPRPPPPAPPPRRRAPAVALAGAATIAATVAAMVVWLATTAVPDGTAEAGGPRADAAAVGHGQPPPPVADPTGVQLASKDIQAQMIGLGTREDGTLEVPADAHTAGWWTGGARPGEQGASVIVGHVDSHHGPGAFFGLADVAAGERVTVTRVDGSTVHFRVQRVERYPKEAFPTEAVYGHSDAPTLRLVTCGGRFDRVARSYEDNVVVYAELDVDEAREAQLVSDTPVEPAGGPPSDVDGPDVAGAGATTSRHEDRGVPVGLAAFGVVGTAAVVTCQALRTRP